MDINSVLAIIGSLSPSLAAYHHVKFQNTDTPHTPLSRCARCGHILLPGSSHTRVARSFANRKRKYKARSDHSVLCMRQSCATCGHVNNTLLHPTMPHSVFHSDGVITPPPPPLKVVPTPHTHHTDQSPLPDPDPDLVPSSHLHSPHPLPSPSPLTNPQPQLQAKSKRSRPKHKAGLQEMLARNKDRQREAANRDSPGLATFLHTL
jgi:hypothetical protein